MTNPKPYSVWIPLIWGAMVLTVVALIIAASVGVPIGSLLASGAVALFFCFRALRKFYAARGGTAQAVQQSQAVFSGECLAHWQFSPQEWAAYADRAYARTKPLVARKLRIVAPVIVACLAIPFVSSGALSSPWPWPALIGLPLAALAAGFIYFFYSIPGRGRRKLLDSKPEVWIGPDGVFQIGQYSPWAIAGRKLASVTLNRDPAPEIVFNILVGTAAVQVYTPVPRGQEREAEEVVQHLTHTQPASKQTAGASGV